MSAHARQFTTELEIARSVAREVLAYWTTIMPAELNKVLSNERRDVKLKADFELQKIILSALAMRSEIPVLAEEAQLFMPQDEALTWVVDPLDGTFNFHREIPFYSTALALCRGVDPVLGVVVDLPFRRVISGGPGLGCFVNNSPVTVSTTADLTQAVLVTGFPTGADFSTSALSEFVNLVQRFKKIRMLGSAALALAYVATGNADAYIEQNSNIWDVAAGVALVFGAGGRVKQVRSKANPLIVSVTADNGQTLILN